MRQWVFFFFFSDFFFFLSFLIIFLYIYLFSFLFFFVFFFWFVCRKRSEHAVASWKTKSETRMAASVLKQDPHTRRVKKNATDCDKIQHANFRDSPLYQAKKKKKKTRKKTTEQTNNNNNNNDKNQKPKQTNKTKNA